MKKRFPTIIAALLCGCSLAIADTTLGIPVELLESERNLLPDKSIETTIKTLHYRKEANPVLKAAVDTMMTIVCDNAYDCRTFLITIEETNGIYTATLVNHDPTTSDVTPITGVMVKDGRHFMFKADGENGRAVKSLVDKDREKVKYVREFEFVEEKQEQRPTLVAMKCDSNNTVTLLQATVEGENLNANPITE